MAFIGAKPTNVPLTSADLEDGLITNSKLAQDIISGETELATAPADTDELLISDAGVLKRIDASLVGGSGGMMTLVTRTAITSSAGEVVFTNLEANNYHKFLFQGIDSTNNGGEDLCLQLSDNNGSSYYAGTDYKWSYFQHYGSGTNNQTASSGSPRICMADGFHNSGTDEGLHGECTISNIGNGQRAFAWFQTAHKADTSTKIRATSGSGFLENGATINAIKFFFDTGNVSGSSYAFITHYKGVIA